MRKSVEGCMSYAQCNSQFFHNSCAQKPGSVATVMQQIGFELAPSVHHADGVVKVKTVGSQTDAGLLAHHGGVSIYSHFRLCEVRGY